MEKFKSRALREKQAYDHGTVLENSARLHRRFQHVLSCPNTRFGEKYFSEVFQKCCNGVVLDYGCYNGHLSRQMLEFNPRALVGIDISEKGVRGGQGQFA